MITYKIAAHELEQYPVGKIFLFKTDELPGKEQAHIVYRILRPDQNKNCKVVFLSLEDEMDMELVTNSLKNRSDGLSQIARHLIKYFYEKQEVTEQSKYE